jgi:putative tryptophan/tyrosine transport system substrate-binding protein
MARHELGEAMKRRQFLGVLTGGAVWPLAAHGQQPAMPIVGFLRSSALADSDHLVAAFRQGLKEAGFVEDQNVLFEVRWAENDPNRLSGLAMELIRRPVTVFVGNLAAALAAKAATATVPIVFLTGSDPVQDGLVVSLNRPGGNVTGVNFLGGMLGAKRLELLRQLVPQAATIAMLVNPNALNTEAERRDVQAAAQAVGQKLTMLDASNAGEIESAFADLAHRRPGALLVGSGSFMTSHRERVVALATRHALPTSFAWREAVEAGGLMSYGPSITDAYRQVGIYAGRILKGEKPADMPVMQSSKFEFVINLKTAKALGIEIHPQLLATADEVIE